MNAAIANPNETFLPVDHVARRLGVPVAWLKSEVEAGRVPALRAGRRTMLNPADVERVLLDRAAVNLRTSEVTNA